MRELCLLVLVAFLPIAAHAQDAPFRPHYVSQRVAQAFLREGPGYAYKVLWVYRHKGYPFKESASFDVWRRVTAPDGAVGWINGQMLSDGRTVLVTGKGRVEIRQSDQPDSKVIGLADPDAVLSLKSCEADVCRVRAEHVDGWISRTRIWGVDPDELFK